MYFAILSALFVAANAAQKWDGLRVTFSPDPLNPWAYNSMPRSISAAGSDYSMRDNQCATGGAKFLGQRYWYKKDPAVVLLFDKNGIIAGIQTSLPKSKYTPPSTQKNRNYVDDGDYWSLTVYFVDPQTICSTGRTLDQLNSEGTGTGLWQQVGPDPVRNSVHIPMNENDMRQTPWTFGKCFPGMGNHYWYNTTQDMDCDYFVPNCMLYNKGQLTAFCFAMDANLVSDRYEKLTPAASACCLNPIDCFWTEPSYSVLTTLHVYMMDNARVTSLC